MKRFQKNNCYKIIHDVLYHFKIFHNGFVETFTENKPNLQQYPKEGDEKIQCWFNTKDWAHVSFSPTPFYKYFTQEVILLFSATLLCIFGIVFNLFGESKVESKKE